MSDSYSIGRTRAEVKRRKPPKRPGRPSPHLAVTLLWLAAALLYYAAASHARNMILIGLSGLVTVVSVQALVRWWRWRAWSAWSGESVEWEGRIMHLIDWAFAVWIWAYIILALT